VEPSYDRDEAQSILTVFQQSRTTPPSFLSLRYGLPVDAKFQGTDSTPSIVLLNFMYGVAAYKRWKSPPGVDIAKHQQVIPVPRPRAPSGEGENSSEEQEDPKDSGYLPEGTTSMVEAMDELNMVLTYLSGITPEEAAIRREKRLEEEEKMAQEAGRSKVLEWIDTVR
jgi:hypothetical protein